MSDATHVSMHADHKYWLTQNGYRLDDLHVWQKELEAAQGKLSKLEAIMKKHQDRLCTHGAAVRGYELNVREHEHAIAEFEQGESGDALPEMAKSHLLESGKHAELRAKHEQIKHQHHVILAHWQSLLKALKECVEPSK